MKNQVMRFLILFLISLPTCNAFFRNLMIGDTAMARVDPIMAPGKPGQHVHHLNGGSNLDFQSTGETLSASNCTNSMITVDKSAYWAPWLYFQHDNGTFEDVKLALGLTAYYKYETRGIAGPNVPYSVFPKSLRMISGNSTKRTWTSPWPVPAESFWGPDDMTQVALQEKAMGFNCMNYEPGKNEASFAYPWLRNKTFLDTNCINGVRAEIIFPSCWDGKNLDSPDHKSHVAFPTLIQDGACPPTHPIYLPILFYETIWQTNNFANQPGEFVFANGDPTGYGYHADFIAAWDDGIQEAVRDNPSCTGITTDGEVDTCPVFNGKIQSQADANSCKLTLSEAIIDEATDGLLDGLPGAIKITGERHDPGSVVNQPQLSSSTSMTGSPTTASASAAPPDSTLYHSASVAATTMATSITPSSDTSPGNALSTSTSIYTSGQYVVEMVIIETVTTTTITTVPVMTHTVIVNDTKFSNSPSGSNKARHAHRHARKQAVHARGRL